MIPPEALGPLAGLSTSVLWVFTTICFTEGGRRIGPTSVNALRLFGAVALHAGTFRLLQGHALPDLDPRQWRLLAASGLVGLSLCDQCLFQSFLDLGPRRAVLVMTTAPLFAALFGALFLGEHLGAAAVGAMGLTLAAVVWVVRERGAGPAAAVGSRTRGLVLASIAAVAQAAGSLLGKRGLGHGWLPAEEHLDPQTATFVRMMFGALGVVPVLLVAVARGRLLGGVTGDGEAPNRAQGLAFVAVGTVLGPFLGVWASFVAFDRLPIGVAQTLCSLTPVLILPISVRFYGERWSARAVGGALLALAGSLLLVLESSP